MWLGFPHFPFLYVPSTSLAKDDVVFGVATPGGRCGDGGTCGSIGCWLGVGVGVGVGLGVVGGSVVEVVVVVVAVGVVVERGDSRTGEIGIVGEEESRASMLLSLV